MEKFPVSEHYVPLFAATIGTGNIVGVAYGYRCRRTGCTLFWMIVAATVGTATKVTPNVFLAIKYRTVADDGHIVGGPFYYIEKGMGENWIMACENLCCFRCYGRSFSVLVPSHRSMVITSAVNNFFDENNAGQY